MAILGFIKWCWQTSDFRIKITLLLLLSTIMMLFIKEFLFLYVLSFIILVGGLIFDAFTESWKNYQKSKQSLINTIKNSEK